MKKLLLIIFLLALAPLATRAQYGPGGTQSLPQHHAEANANVEAAKQRSSTTPSGGFINYSPTPAEKAARRRKKATNQVRRAENKEAKQGGEDNMMLDKGTGKVRPMTKAEQAKHAQDMDNASDLVKRMKKYNDAQEQKAKQ